MYIRLTSKVRELTDDAQRRMKDAEKKAVEMFDRKSGRLDEEDQGSEYYKNLGLPVPRHIEDNENGVQIILTDNDYVDTFKKALVNTDKVEFFEEEDSDYVVAVYHSGESMLVTDTIGEIEKLINK